MKNIAKRETIVELLGYLHNPDKETVITPANVANLPYERLGIDWSAERVKQSTFYDINIKSGIFPFLAAYNLGKANPDTQWETILRRSIFGNMRTKAAKYITLRILGLKRNSVEAENFTVIDINRIRLLIPKWNDLQRNRQPSDWTEITDSHEFISTLLMLSNKGFLREKGAHLEHPTWIKLHETVDEFVASVNQGSDVDDVKKTLAKLARLIMPEKDSNPLWKEFRFDYLVSNPPYQIGRYQLYAEFYLVARKIANKVSMIFPEGWQRPVNTNGLDQMNRPEVKEDRQIVLIDNYGDTLFNANTTANIVLWEREHDNQLDGKQKIYSKGQSPITAQLPMAAESVDRGQRLSEVLNRIQANEYPTMDVKISKRKPYVMGAGVFNEREPGLDYSRFSTEKKDNKTVTIIGLQKRNRGRAYVDKEYFESYLGSKKRKQSLASYKIFVPKAWGNMSESQIGGAYSDIVLGRPGDACTETFLEILVPRKDQKNMAKYLLTKHLRFCLFMAKTSQNSASDKWVYIPVEDFSEDWWESEDIETIDRNLSKKYGYEDIRHVLENVQGMNWENVKEVNGYPIVGCDFDSWK